MLLAQLAPATHDVAANVATACRLLDEHPDADLAVFPELFLHAYALKGLEPIAADRSPLLEPLLAAAGGRHTALVVGVAEDLDGTMANSALCIDERGEITACYRKVQLFGAENRFFVPGEEYVIATLAAVRVGLLICYDLEFPEPARALAVAGAELLVTISANMDPYGGDHALFLRSRALENARPHVYVNCVGVQGRLRFCGGSAATDSRGNVLTELPAYRPGVQVVDVPLGDVAREATAPTPPDYLAERRPDVPVRVAARAVRD